MIIKNTHAIRKEILECIIKCNSFSELSKTLYKKYPNQSLNNIYNLRGKLIGIKLNNTAYTYSDEELKF